MSNAEVHIQRRRGKKGAGYNVVKAKKGRIKWVEKQRRSKNACLIIKDDNNNNNNNKPLCRPNNTKMARPWFSCMMAVASNP